MQQKTNHKAQSLPFQKLVEDSCHRAIFRLKKIMRSHLFFHIFFLSTIIFEIFGLFLLLNISAKSLLLASAIALTILTLFTYLIFTFYFQSRKPIELHALRTHFMKICQQALPKNLGESEYHLSLANAAYQLANTLKEEDLLSLAIPFKFPSLKGVFNRLGQICHADDIRKMKEQMIHVSIQEHVQLIKREPTDIEAHASLANAYVGLAKIYRDQPSFEKLFRSAIEKALQEYQIIDNYSPRDPWVHAQMALCYRDLEMVQEEKREYEHILELCPNDREILFRLGKLYFSQGQTAKGLQMYEQLKSLHSTRAQMLIDFYDAHIKVNPLDSRIAT